MDEEQAAVVPEGIHPAGQKHLAAGVVRGQLAAKDTIGERA